MTRLERNLLAAIALVVAVLCARIVRAQEADDETTLVLAQTLVAEAGWTAETDHAAIAHVLRRNADRLGVPLADYAIRYVSLLRVNADGRHVVQSERAQWVRGLSLGAAKPNGWPSNLSWALHVERWLHVVETARAFLRGELLDPCAGERPVHWGGSMDSPRGSMVPAVCSGRTANTFYRVSAR